MKNIIFVFVFASLMVTQTLAQNSCCTAPHNSFAALGNESAFVLQHEEPLPFSMESEYGKMITFATPDGSDANAYAIESEKASTKYLIVIHEWWGLNDYVKTFSEKFYADLDNIHVIAVDLYDGKVASTREDAQKYMQSLTAERGNAILEGLLYKIGKDAEILTVGWCMGGGWSLQMALQSKTQAKGAIMYYGMPEKNTEKLEMLHCPVLFFHAKQDKWINDEVVNTFEKNMKDLDKKLTLVEYDADHAFANPSNPNYNKEAADDAYIKSITFLKNAF